MPPRTRRAAPARDDEVVKQEDVDMAGTEVSEAADATAADATAADATATDTKDATTAPRTRSFAFKPKMVRRTDDERRALAEQEEKKLNDRVAEEARLKREASRGRGRGRGGRGRGRGDFAGGRDGLVRRTVAPDGPFSQLPGVTAHAGSGSGRTIPGRAATGGGFSAGQGGGFSSGSGGGRGGGSSFAAAAAADREHDPRLNTDTFMGRSSPSEHEHGQEHETGAGADSHASPGGASAASGPSTVSSASRKSAHLLPMGIRREEHREPEVVVATTAELEAAAAALAVDESDDDDDDDNNENENDDLFVAPAALPAIDDDDEVWSRAIAASGGVVRLTGADGQPIEVTSIDELAAKRAEVAAALDARAAVKQEDDAMALDSVPPIAAPVKKTKKTKKKANADGEQASVEQGLQAMLHDLALDQPPRLDAGEGVPVVDLTETDGKEAPRREGRLFLFQFPPVLPSLEAVGSDSAVDNTVDVDADITVDTGADAINIKLEADDAPVDLTAKGSPNNLDAIGAGGFLGKLRIRQSGRAELSWGGMTYEMMPGTDVQFLTTAVLLEDADTKPAPGAMAGNAFGMGPVGGKYNLVPVFSDEADWVVDPADLQA